MNLAEHDSGTKRSAIFEELRRNILEKRYANGKLPSERALMRRFSVSRTHIRSILDELKVKGYIFARLAYGAVQRQAFCFANTHTDHVSELAKEKGMLLVIERMKVFGRGRLSCSRVTTTARKRRPRNSGVGAEKGQT